MEEELVALRKQLAESQSRYKESECKYEEQQRREEEQRLRKKEQRLDEEDQRLRSVANANAEQSQPKNLVEYLGSCHAFSTAIEVVVDKTLTSQGDTTKPAGRLFPQRIVPWNEFPQQQETVWEKLSHNALFTTQRVYPSAHQLEYVKRYLCLINSELGLRHHTRDTVENPVQTFIQEIYKIEPLREQLRLEGILMFESHTNVGDAGGPSNEEEAQHMSVSEPNASTTGAGEQGASGTLFVVGCGG